MRSKPFAAVIVGLLFSLLAVRAESATNTIDPTNFIDDLGKRVLAIFNDPQLTSPDRETRLHTIAVEAFDVPRIARSTLGRHWATASQSQREQFTKVFEHYMVHVYAARFSQYHDATLKILGKRNETKMTAVRTEIIQRRDVPPAKVNWWVMKDGNVYKIVDVDVEGVSQLVTLREEFSAVIARNGGQLSALIDRLREKTGE
jgi:phospholipid transport system substrate-binding protein